MLDSTLEAHAVGVSATFKDPALGTVKNLPQRLTVIAQGETGVSFSTTKFTGTGAGMVGGRAGYKSLAYQIAKQLWPSNGDGVGSVPVTFILLADDASGVAAAGSFTPSGTATESASYRANINEILGAPFVIPAGAVGVTAACKKLKESIDATLGMPGTAGYTYSTVTSSVVRAAGTPSNGTIGTFTTTGNPKPGAWTLECTAEASNAGTFRLTDPDGIVVSTTVTIGAQVQGGLGFTLSDGAEDYNIGDKFTITVPVTAVTFTAGWKGLTGNDLDIRVDGPATSVGVEWAYVQPSGGLVDPSPSAAIAQIGNSWETMIQNGLHISNGTALDTYKDWGVGRWASTVKKPVLVFTGAAITTYEEGVAVPDARKTDYINVQLSASGSRNLPAVIAARQLARIVKLANNIPAHDYCGQVADGLTPGLDSQQWDLGVRDQALKKGCSTIEVVDNQVRIGNVVTFSHPTGEDPPVYRYVVDVVKIMNVVYNVNRVFEAPEWSGAPLVPDGQVVTEPTAKQPHMAVADMAFLLDNLGQKAIISDPAASKKTVRAVIAAPKRLDVTGHFFVSGNTNVIDVPLTWSFFTGG